MLVIIASVVSIRAEIEAAFWRADRVTLVGSTIPAANMSTYSAVLALKPIEPVCRLDLLDDHPAVVSGVGRDVADGLFEGPEDDLGADLFVAGQGDS